MITLLKLVWYTKILLTFFGYYHQIIFNLWNPSVVILLGIVGDSNAYDQSKRLRTGGGDCTHSVYSPSPFHPPPPQVWGPPHGWAILFFFIYIINLRCYLKPGKTLLFWYIVFCLVVYLTTNTIWFRYLSPAAPPYDPYGGYHAPPVPMPPSAPIAAPSSYVPVQVKLHFYVILFI